MRSLFLLPLCFTAIAVAQHQTLVVSQGSEDLKVLSHKWSKTRRVTGNLNSNEPPPPAPSLTTSAARNAQKADRLSENGGPRVAADSMDGRSATLEKMIRESRTPPPKMLDGYSYSLKIKNESTRQIEVVFWEYQFIDGDTSNVTRRQFLCGLNLKPAKEKELVAFSMAGPSKVVNATTLAATTTKPLAEKVIINRLEYSDGTIWQRQDWSFAEIRLSYKNAMATPWTEMCRGL
ncbi:MAG TPA: hypothetical protein VJS64_17705 [Pyrinomonadaceae bacterium]|nr:hypothetical protein [Pyrinomonadaceae bacterium]